MSQRVTLRKRQPYNTTSNRRRIVKTPGGKKVYHHIKKLATAPKCGDCELKLPGVRVIIIIFDWFPPTMANNSRCKLGYNLLICDLCRSLHFALVNMLPSQNVKRLFDGHMVGADAVLASVNGTFCRPVFQSFI